MKAIFSATFATVVMLRVTVLLGDASPAVAADPCDVTNMGSDYAPNLAMGAEGAIAIFWTPTVTDTITRLEVFTGHSPTQPNPPAGTMAFAIWSDDGSAGGKPLAALGSSSQVPVDPTIGWQGADLNSIVTVTAGARYWFIFEYAPGQQAPLAFPGGAQPLWWGASGGTAQGPNNWVGPSSQPFTWKFRVFCSVPVPSTTSSTPPAVGGVSGLIESENKHGVHGVWLPLACTLLAAGVVIVRRLRA